MNKTIKKITEQDLQYIVDNWEKMDTVDIAAHLGMSKISLVGHVTALRKFGVPLAFKSRGATNRKVIMAFADKWKKEHRKQGK